jgi:lambda repressor-like predicted transcriptional regulator
MTQDYILRKDTRGRVVVTAERRAGLLAQFDQSGISGIQFAKLAGVKYSTLASWLQQRRKRQRGMATEKGMKKGTGTRSLEFLPIAAILNYQ